ncbi:unnamed protein product [Schistosoma rodhaini]|uniref:O-methyltransferase domain-containing protein n=1 Tax=Schistosoma rodhaini TaxID=6188 RepID=A0AA85G0R0_9TREM|nr:unnamed protein product [Schistosoma rodhaini]CAH8603756.1 unnamed protein product [Schistosoma rodhaini]
MIDADKENYSNYYKLCLKLVRPRGIIAIDNVLWSHRVLDPNDNCPQTVSIREMNELIAEDKSIRVSLLRTGDGLTIVVKK